MPAGRSAEVRSALRLTEERLCDEVRFEDVAAAVGLVPRWLARRFEAEVGMTWRDPPADAGAEGSRAARSRRRPSDEDRPRRGLRLAVGVQPAFRELTGLTPSDYRATFTR